MAKLTITEIQSIPSSLLEEFKQYASMPDASQDSVLQGLLKSALLRVQEYGDRALIQCTARQIATIDEETGILQLYLGGGDVVSVTDTIDGNSVDYEAIAGGKLRVFARGREVEVVFVASPVTGELERCKATVLRYATALFDGDNTEALNSILNEVL